MKQKILVNYEIISPEEEKNEKEKINFYYDACTTFDDLRKELNVPCLSVISKLPTDEEKMNLTNFSYILGNDRVYWNIPILRTKIVDYLSTFGYHELFVVSVDGVGCPYFENLKCVLEITQNIFQYLWGILGIVGNIFTVKEIINYFKKYITEEYEKHGNLIDNNGLFYSVLCREDWDLSDFSNRYKLEEAQAEIFLRLLGYSYDSGKQLYHITKSKKKKMVEDIENISRETVEKFFDIGE